MELFDQAKWLLIYWVMESGTKMRNQKTEYRIDYADPKPIETDFIR